MPRRRPKFRFTIESGRKLADLDGMAARQAAALETDHRNGRPRDNRPENVVPACGPCNRERRDAGNPIVFKNQTTRKVFEQVGVLFGEIKQRTRAALNRLLHRHSHPRPDQMTPRDDCCANFDRDERGPPDSRRPQNDNPKHRRTTTGHRAAPLFGQQSIVDVPIPFARATSTGD